MPRRDDIKSILIIGAGPIIIGQACEFDYSGAQACKALKADGYRVILVNSNPATIMTDPEMEITRLYGVRNIPITYLVDPSGVIIGRALGPREWSEPKLLKFFRIRMNRQEG